MKHINESSAEQLFIRYFFATLGLKNTNFFAPRTNEELMEAYYSKEKLFPQSKEVFLQFKKVSYNEISKQYTMEIDAQQHLNILNLFPPKTAYYVFSMVETIDDFLTLQSNVNSSQEFLHSFTCIDATSIPLNGKRIKIENYPFDGRTQPKPYIDYPERQDYKTIKDSSFKASMLSKKFKDGDIGSTIEGLIAGLKNDLVLTDSESVDPEENIWRHCCQVGYLK